ncbi:hypothetical protein FHS12_004145 [Nocardioides albus]|uniref:Uncharacterized protein n=1 Tax=Nocardioides albus TaxID=1841 RepID=A0A7W5FAH6_9ACTN|nr:hypothetical protein [Nocardioides albus]
MQKVTGDQVELSSFGIEGAGVDLPPGVRSATPDSSACRCARASPFAEKSAPVTVHPWCASQITSPPSPQPTSSAVPGVSAETSATS